LGVRAEDFVMRISVLLASFAAIAALACAPARADVLIQVDKSTQTMVVTVDSRPTYSWPVSTGIARYDTPGGEFQPFRMDRDHFSREWDNAPMPYAIFFTQQGHAIHGTNHSSIGRPASHGCVRLSVAHAKTLFDLVKQQGVMKTKVVLSGEIPGTDAGAIARREPAQPRYQARYQDRYQDRYQEQASEDDYTGSLPPRTRVYRAAPRYYDDRYAPPPRYEGRGFFPYGW
jgi:hypothetical protein